MSTPRTQAWYLLPEAEALRAFEHPWPPPADGYLRIVIDGALGGLERDDQLALYFDLAEKLLAVFRELVPPDGWLYALDWHHTSHRFFPHVPFETDATLEEMTGNYTREHFELAKQGIHPAPFTPRWDLSIHPDGDPEHIFAAPDFRFVFSGRYAVRDTEVETYELRGQPLIDAVERHLPELFRRGRRFTSEE